MKVTTREVKFRDPNGRMVSSLVIGNGSLHDEVADYLDNNPEPVATATGEWLTENITQPTTPVVDASLSVSGAAADSKKVGDELSDLKSQIGDLDDLETTDKSSLVNAINEASGTGGGLTNEAKIALANGFANVAWSNANGLTYYDAIIDALDIQYPCTGISLDESTLSIREGSASVLTATVTPTNTTDPIIWSSSNESVATVAGGQVTGVTEGNCVITATCGNYSATCSVSIVWGGTSYTITNTLTNCTSSNSATSVHENATFTTTLIADTGYELASDDVTVTLAGTDVTGSVYDSTTGVITVVATGNIVITATATVAVVPTWTTGVAYDISGSNVVEGVTINTSGVETASESDNSTGYLNCVGAYSIYVTPNTTRVFFYDKNKAFISSSYKNVYYSAHKVPSNATYFRFSGTNSSGVLSDGTGSAKAIPMALPTEAFTSGTQTLTWTNVDINPTDGTEKSVSNRCSSNYISLFGASSFSKTPSGYGYLFLYDTEKNFILRTNQIDLSNITNENLFYFAYVRLGMVSTSSSSSVVVSLA